MRRWRVVTTDVIFTSWDLLILAIQWNCLPLADKVFFFDSAIDNNVLVYKNVIIGKQCPDLPFVKKNIFTNYLTKYNDRKQFICRIQMKVLKKKKMNISWQKTKAKHGKVHQIRIHVSMFSQSELPSKTIIDFSATICDIEIWVPF